MSSHESSTPSLLKQAALQIIAGGSAGFVEVCIMHPLDLVKTRLQIQSKKTVGAAGAGNQLYYDGVIDCFRKMYRSEGVFSYWKGILPPILAETPKRATKFVCFEQYKRFFLFGSDKPTPLVSIPSLIIDCFHFLLFLNFMIRVLLYAADILVGGPRCGRN